MKIATLSFQLSGSQMSIAGGERVKHIVSLAKMNLPDLLACAGWSIDSLNDMKKIENESKSLKTTFLVEVQHDLDHLHNTPSHVMYAITGGTSKRLGPQFFATSGELSSACGDELLSAFEKNAEDRMFIVKNKLAFALCCGELNVLKGRNSVSCRSKIIESKLNSADIVINPTHDRMGNGGTLKAKRKYLSNSKEKESKTSISISNWNISKPVKNKIMKQSQTSPTLHTVYHNGESIEPLIIQRETGEYEFQMFEIGDLKS